MISRPQLPEPVSLIYPSPMFHMGPLPIGDDGEE